LPRRNKADLVGGSPAENARITRAVLSGQRGARRDAVLLNSAAAIYAARPNVPISEGIKIAAETIDCGKAEALLARFIELSGGVAR
jgi:anthranilate phosphoribosyltransferase